jgi:hypothetical protein
MTTQAISSGPKGTVGARIFLGLFFLPFLAVGLGFGGLFFGRPVLRMIEARGWTPVSCEILSSGVEQRSDEDGSTYRVAVTYRYHVDDRPLIGDRYKFVPGSSSGRARKLAVVERLPVGTRTTCYVNPSNPADAVVERGPTGDLWFGVIPLTFAIVGATGVAAAFLGRGPMASRLIPNRTPVTHMVYEDAPQRRRSAQLLPLQSRGAKVGGFLFFALFWNGIVSVFLVQLVSNWRSNAFDVFLSLFLTPFILVGMLLIVVAVQMTLSYFNPLPLITVNSPVVPLGGELRVRWAIDGRVEKLRRFTVVLEGREEATYRRGTDTHTNRHVFARFRIVDAVSPVPPQGGSAKVTIPQRTMHSFAGRYNKIVWVLRVLGDIPSWPDSEDEFAVTIAPRAR